MKLDELRFKWEKNCTPLLVITKVVDSYLVVFVVLQSAQYYCLQRYFKLGNDAWECNLDVGNSSAIQDCLDKITEEFGECYPS